MKDYLNALINNFEFESILMINDSENFLEEIDRTIRI